MGNDLIKFPSQIDLLEAAICQYDFLRLVDSYPVLFNTSTLQNAMFRYESYWLPLAAERSEPLPAPLDIEWIWHCHVLNPIAYSLDCQKIVGKVVDHEPMFLVNTSRETSKTLWCQKYPSVPYDVNLTITNPMLLNTEYKQQSSYNVIDAAQRQRSFNYNSSLPHYRDEKFLKHAIKRYKVMVMIKRDNPSTYVVPCYDNDLIWHTHQQFVTRYQSDTKSILGKILDHDDSTNDRSPGSQLDQGSSETKKLWQKNGQSFGVSGAMFRGEAPLPLIETVPNRFASLMNRTTNHYTFYVNPMTYVMMEAQHLKDVLTNIQLIAPSSVYKNSVPCQYSDHTIITDTGINAFAWKTVHCKNPTLSAVEVRDLYGNVISSVHTIGSNSLPTKKQVLDTSRTFTHKPSVERAILIRGTKGDWGILKASWIGFTKGRAPGFLNMELLILNGKNSKWYPVNPTGNQLKRTQFHWSTNQGNGWVDLETGSITVSNVNDVPEYISVGCAISVAFVLCQPRPPPPPAYGRYTPPPFNRPYILNIDAMRLLVAAGLYSSSLPRWYHTSCHDRYFYQIHPRHLHSRRRRRRRRADERSDNDDYYASGVVDFEDDDHSWDVEDISGEGWDSGCGDWGDFSGASCGGCGGGDSGGGGCGGGDSGGGCGGGGCGGGGCGGGD